MAGPHRATALGAAELAASRIEVSENLGHGGGWAEFSDRRRGGPFMPQSGAGRSWRLEARCDRKKIRRGPCSALQRPSQKKRKTSPSSSGGDCVYLGTPRPYAWVERRGPIRARRAEIPSVGGGVSGLLVHPARTRQYPITETAGQPPGSPRGGRPCVTRCRARGTRRIPTRSRRRGPPAECRGALRPSEDAESRPGPQS